VAIALTSLYGLSDELHQHYAGRSATLGDAAADAVGAVAAAALWPWLSRMWPAIRVRTARDNSPA